MINSPTLLQSSKIYTKQGEILDLPTPKEEPPIFRKEFYYSNHEKYIAKLLLQSKLEHVVSVKQVNTEYYDAELLDTFISHPTTQITKQNKAKIMEDMHLAKKEMQECGIMYIDWKLDNIGMDSRGTYKIFDFDCSGFANMAENTWILTPPSGWLYNTVKKTNMDMTPIEIDNACFDLFLRGL